MTLSINMPTTGSSYHPVALCLVRFLTGLVGGHDGALLQKARGAEEAPGALGSAQMGQNVSKVDPSIMGMKPPHLKVVYFGWFFG